jgi:ribonuclease HII
MLGLNMLKNHMHKSLIEAGCDEAGRGCLAGPVYAATVILPKNYKNKLLNDSKKLSEKNRFLLRDIIMKEALDYAVIAIDHHTIDKINILNASILGMQEAVLSLKTKPAHLLIDGNRFKSLDGYKHTTVVKGDGIYMSIAAASILAKTERDLYMQTLHLQYPEYGWNKNMGYPTAFHREALLTNGPSPFHRTTFKVKPKQIQLDIL